MNKSNTHDHGTTTSYRAGCRCQGCVDAKRKGNFLYQLGDRPRLDACRYQPRFEGHTLLERERLAATKAGWFRFYCGNAKCFTRMEGQLWDVHLDGLADGGVWLCPRCAPKRRRKAVAPPRSHLSGKGGFPRDWDGRRFPPYVYRALRKGVSGL